MICPTCSVEFPDGTTTCVHDGSSLVPSAALATIDRDVPPGTVVGEYRIETKLGEGGFGAVYRATHPLIGKSAAVKILSRQFSSSPTMVSRFVAEARAVNQIRHRNIIDIFSFGQLPDGRQYYIMELLEGQSFDAFLTKKKRLTIQEALPILRGIARALDAAHSKGILHRDLKPENVFLLFDEDGHVVPKLLDFGLVKLLSDVQSGQHKTKTGTPMGTPYYMSPEQCRGLDVDARTDVYSFGALVFEVLCGEVPYNGETTMDILVQHMTAAIPLASGRCPDVPYTLDGPIKRMLSKDPSERPSKVLDAFEELAHAAGMTVPTSAGSAALQITPAEGNFAVRQSESAIATATTMIGEPNISLPPAAQVAQAQRAGGQTFLGGAEVVEPAKRRSRGWIPIAIVAACLAVGGAAFVATRNAPAPARLVAAPSTPPAAASSTVEVPAPPPVRTEVELRVDATPPDAVVSVDGVELGPAPGPFKLKINVPVKLTLAAKGYKPSEPMAITPADNVLVPITLEKLKVGGKKPPPGPGIHSDLDAFDNKK